MVISTLDTLRGFGEVLTGSRTGSRVGVLSQPVTDATIPVSTPVVAGTVENGAVVTTTGSIQALRGKVDSAGQSTTATSISASFPMDALTTPSISLVWPFSIPWDLDRFFSTVLPEPSFPDEIDIPFVTGYLPDMTMKLDTSMIKRLHDIIKYDVRDVESFGFNYDEFVSKRAVFILRVLTVSLRCLI